MFDGHGGAQAADFCAAHLCRVLKEQICYASDPATGTFAVLTTYQALTSAALPRSTEEGLLRGGSEVLVCGQASLLGGRLHCSVRASTGRQSIRSEW